MAGLTMLSGGVNVTGTAANTYVNCSTAATGLQIIKKGTRLYSANSTRMYVEINITTPANTLDIINVNSSVNACSAEWRLGVLYLHQVTSLFVHQVHWSITLFYWMLVETIMSHTMSQ